jgi:Aspartyl protease
MPEKAVGVLRICALALLLLGAKASPAAADCASEQVPFEYAHGRNSILLHVLVNNKPARLILDTGSAHTVLRPEAVGLNPKELIPTHTASGGAGFIGDAVGQEVSLQVGSWKREKRRVAVMDLSQVLSAYQEKIDGVLGLDFFKEFSQVTINFKDKTITFIGRDGTHTLTYQKLGKAETVAVLLDKEKPHTLIPDSKKHGKEFEELLMSAPVIRKAMDLVALGGVETWPKYGYDSVAVFSDPEAAFPGADERTLDWIRGALMFTPAKGKNMFPIYVNLSALRKQPLLDPTGGNDPETVAAILSVMFVHELRHEKGDGELETMGAIDRQIAWLVRNQKLSPAMGDAVHRWAEETHGHESEFARTQACPDSQ